MRNLVLWGVLAVILALVNDLIYDKEAVLAEGEAMLLELQPRDPRSLLQGDYMSLRYRLGSELASRTSGATADGHVVVRLDDQRVARLVRVHDGTTPLATDERLLRFRKRGGAVRIAGDAFFFQEGQAAIYQPARYGELRVARGGEAVLVGLRDADFRVLAPDQRGPQ
jgi:uncharacterized membrane-anchored protein